MHKSHSKNEALVPKKQETAEEIFTELNSKPTSAARRLVLLNGFVKTINTPSKDGDVFSAYTTEDILISLRTSMIHEFTQVRAGVLRTLRYTLKTSRDIQIFNELQLPQLLCRSIEIGVDNEEERVQAFKLIRKILSIAPDIMSPLITRSLVSSSECGIEDGDRMLRACLAILCEIGVLNPVLMILCGGVNAITRTVLECHSPRIAESLCGVLLHLLEWPHTRNIAGVRLDCLAAPYCDFTYRLGIMDKNKHARDLRFTCSRLALLSVLRSWPGTLEFCDPNKPSGLKAIVDVLYLNQLEVRKAILDLLYELLWLPQPVWTDEYSVAIAAIDPADYQDAWRLGEGFVAMEGRHILPSLANRVSNISEIHTSVLLYCFLETGLLNALIGVIVSSAAFISVRATILIGKLLQLMHTHLPADICNASSALPALITYASQGNPQATAAVSALQHLHKVLQNRPASCSLFLDAIIQSGAIINSPVFKREIESTEININPPMYGILERSRYDSVGSSTSGEEPSTQTLNRRGSMKKKKFLQFIDGLRQSENLMKESNVFANDDGMTWDWDIITTIFTKTNTSNKLDIKFTRFLRRLMHFYKPSSNRFSHQDIGLNRYIPSYVTAGIKMIDWLLKNAEMESIRLLTDYFSDIDAQLLAICTAKSAHDCLFSPQHMTSTMCQLYFLYIGRMCRSKVGIQILINTHIFKHLIQIVTTTNHPCYIKLIVSGLDYTVDALPRQVLEKALTASERSAGRLYATQFLLVLLRAKIPNFEVWGLPLLVKQTRDKERKVVLAALEILDEACHDRTYLEELVSLWPDFASRGDNGKLLMSRYYSIPRGLNHMKARIQQEIEIWLNVYNKRYVLLVEADAHAHLTLHTRSEDGTYSRRACSSREVYIAPPNILPHLYGQLVQTTQGLENLLKYGQLPQLVDTLIQGKCSNETEILLLKAAVWALGHTSTSTDGIEYLIETAPQVYEKFIFLVKHCEVYSVRAVALHALGLVGTTKAGADTLFKYDWLCVRHNRDTLWPVCETEDWLSKHLTPIRHHLDSVPPYNYTGIDEKISGIFDESASSFLPESVDVGKTDTTSEVDGAVPIAAKSKTLPEYACKYAMIKHKRSLSESKTTDGISLASNANHYVSRTRFNSGTSDSNTSGVSSYESVFGIVMGDLCNKTLSPIPSSSNLLEVKKPNEHFRRISLTGAHFRETTISPQDAQGYAKLRSIRRYTRPQLSESAADELAEIIDINQVYSNRLTIPQNSHRRLKVRSLDRHSCFDMIDSEGSHDVSRVSDIGSYCLTGPYTRGPCYTGICLPKNVMDLFPSARSNGTYVTRCIKDADSMEMVLKHGVIADFISECDEYSVSSLSDISSTTSKRSKINGTKHNRTACLLCCRTAQGINRFNSTNAVPSIGGAPNSSDIDLTGSSSALTATPNKKFPENGNLDTTYNSSESHLSDENYNDKIQETILRHVQRMANPVWSKQSKLALFKIKQKHPHFFRNMCLYSDICVTLSQNTYRFSSRKFLQEIFVDVDYSTFYADAFEVIAKKKALLELKSVEMNNHNDTDTDTVDGVMPTSESNQNATSSPTALVEKVRNPPQILNITTHPIKTHILRSPPLASVYETSRENLSDSLGTHTKSILNSTPIGNDIAESRLQTEVDIEIIPYSSNNKMNSIGDDDSDHSLHIGNDLSARNTLYRNDNRALATHSRPRFNTIHSIDLSCTKNKFPITDRRKTFDLSSSISNSALYSQPTSITKSLSASITSAPSMSLYCEKRLQTSKSEAILTNNNNFMRNSLNFNNHNNTTTTEAHSKNNHLAK
ncbi:rapamycin-insensitive companion of mTOR isoform X2 [Sitodiplosis mosellana]|uniref:rapamycin-insensitive companion of mTOR isoform X2 n=1 Tax=Sitodiplosis mosellana TaxID=263140 RepID=UPI0024441F5E|nr:rapamycin-insensitive companion of mTOR isoform X2 [Sitodiplosis mosellana]